MVLLDRDLYCDLLWEVTNSKQESIIYSQALMLLNSKPKGTNPSYSGQQMVP